MIIATAGHVDHGKTLLVKALTGVDTDRLPEEKKRGMTIDLGFAYLPLDPGETIGFIDVPGHERFVHNMLAGVAGIDCVLFIVAADDGPMPQTREHLAILDLLGINRGAVALTKIDRVTVSRAEYVRNEIVNLLAATTLANSPVFPVSAITGQGIDDLKAHLLEVARDCGLKTTAGNFRLAVDRSFSVPGAGLVVTGTVFAGSLSVGDPVRMLDAGLMLRARMIHAQNTASKSGKVGQRCAINLAGPELKPERIKRGDWVVSGDVPAPIQRFDASIRVLRTELRPLAHWTPIHVHLGAADVTGRVAVLESSSIAAGATGLVQIVLDRHIGGSYGDGLIIRDQSAKRTIGGGRVIDIFPPPRGRARPERLAYLRAMDTNVTASAYSSLLCAAPRGLNLRRFIQNRNLTTREASQLLTAISAKVVDTTSGTLGFSQENWIRLKTTVIESLACLHRRSPNVIPNEEHVLMEAGLRMPREVTSTLTTELVKEGILVREPFGVRLRTHVAQLSPADAILWKKTESLVNERLLHPPSTNEIASALGIDPMKAESFLVRVSRLGLLVRVSENRFFSLPGLRHHAAFAEEVAAENSGTVTAAKLRDRAGIGRTVAIEVLEYFDRIKFTRRIGDQHHVLRPARTALGETRTPL